MGAPLPERERGSEVESRSARRVLRIGMWISTRTQGTGKLLGELALWRSRKRHSESTSEGDLQRIATSSDCQFRQVLPGRTAELPSFEIELRMPEAHAAKSPLVVPVFQFLPAVRTTIDEGVESIVA